ncbi:MAG: DUF2391 family protein [Halodesulfurarchaeum sp.]
MSSMDDGADFGDVFDQLERLSETVDTPAEREQVEETMRMAVEASRNDTPLGTVIWGFDRADAVEAFIGSLLFGIPMAVEGGTKEIGAHLSTHPLSLLGTGLVSIGLTTGVLYIAEIQDVRIKHRLFGLIPWRLAGVLSISFLTASVMLTAWGRISWGDPVMALSSVVIAFLPMSIGAALGDILPGS